MLPVEKHSVPSRASPSPLSVPASAAWLASSGQNSSSRPARPQAPPSMTRGAMGVPNHRRAFTAFQIVAAENTTETRPLGIHCVAA
ncbi:Uncharacterised protein [Bordetella pertussis]|nr:Uncharacterised protein [Bordetella pertussis]